MEFQEILVEHFQSPTTCYSGASQRQRQDDGSNNVVGLATESHGLHVQYAKEETAPPTLDIKSVKLPFKSSSRQARCVGYSRLITLVGGASCLYEAFVMVLDHPITDRDSNKDKGVLDSNVDQDIAANKSSSSILSTANTEQPENNGKLNKDPSTTTTKSWLVLRETRQTKASSNKTIVEYSEALSFRPLSPIITNLPVSREYHDTDDEGSSSTLLGIWVGSADDAQVRFYKQKHDSSQLVPMDLQVVPRRDDNTSDATKGAAQQREATVQDDDRGATATNRKDNSDHYLPFQLDNPVMALDVYIMAQEEESPEHCFVAMACQDGTIQIVEFLSCTLSNPTALQLSSVVLFKTLVDGPIVSLWFALQGDSKRLRLVVGSLCGFVCEVNQQQQEWQEPTMVLDMEDGFQTNNQVQDSVLVVTSWDRHNLIAVGTLLGKVVLLEKQNNDYTIVWQCQLPHPIHGICNLCGHLVVTTKWTIHLFGRVLFYKKLSADLAKQRVLELMRQRNIIPRNLKDSPTNEDDQENKVDNKVATGTIEDSNTEDNQDNAMEENTTDDMDVMSLDNTTDKLQADMSAKENATSNE